MNVLSILLINDGDQSYRVRINGEHIAGRVRWSTDAWTAAIATDDGFDPLPGNYRMRRTAVDDVVAAWVGDHD